MSNERGLHGQIDELAETRRRRSFIARPIESPSSILLGGSSGLMTVLGRQKVGRLPNFSSCLEWAIESARLRCLLEHRSSQLQGRHAFHLIQPLLRATADEFRKPVLARERIRRGLLRNGKRQKRANLRLFGRYRRSGESRATGCRSLARQSAVRQGSQTSPDRRPQASPQTPS